MNDIPRAEESRALDKFERFVGINWACLSNQAHPATPEVSVEIEPKGLWHR